MREKLETLSLAKLKEFAKEHSQYTFLVTEIGCGIAGFAPKEIAPLFKEAADVPNIHLPQRFWDVLNAK